MNISALFSKSWQVYRQQFPLIFVVVAVVWIPFDLLIGYMDVFVFSPDEFLRSYRFARSIENTVGLVCVGAVIQMTVASRGGETVNFSNAMSTSLRLWGWMFWTRLLTNLAIVLGFLALVIPGVYLAVRLAGASQVVIAERHFGTEAMRRSFALTRGHFWPVFLAGVSIYFIFIAAIAFVNLPLFFISVFEHWVMQGIVGFVMHLCYAFVTIAFTELYLDLKAQEAAVLAVAPSEATVQ